MEDTPEAYASSTPASTSAASSTRSLLRRISSNRPTEKGAVPAVAAIQVHVEAGSADWTVQLDGLLSPEAALQPKASFWQSSFWRRRLVRAVVCLLATCLVVTTVVVPVVHIFVLPQPLNVADIMAPALPHLRLLAAVSADTVQRSSNSSSGSASSSVQYLLSQLDAPTRGAVLQTKVLSRTGVVVLGFSSSSAHRAAVAQLSAAPGVQYAVQDAVLTTFRTMTVVADAMQLFQSAFIREQADSDFAPSSRPSSSNDTADSSNTRRRRLHTAAEPPDGQSRQRYNQRMQHWLQQAAEVNWTGHGVDRQKRARNSVGVATPRKTSRSLLQEPVMAIPLLRPEVLPSHLTHPAVAATKVWKVTRGSPQVVVAVVDSGVEGVHPTVGPTMWSNPQEIPGNGIDDDGNGYVDDVDGWSFSGGCVDAACSACLPGPDVSDTQGWGSHAAGVIAGQSMGVQGAAPGVAPGVSVMALQVTDCQTGETWASAVLEAWEYAADNGAAVIQSPLGMTISPSTCSSPVAADNSTSTNSTTASISNSSSSSNSSSISSNAACVAGWSAVWGSAMAQLQQAGVALVTADSGPSNATSWPCSLTGTYSNVLCAGQLLPSNISSSLESTATCVGSSSWKDCVAAARRRGVNIFAPGTDVLAATAAGSHGKVSGPAAAAGIVSGAAALMASRYGQRFGGVFDRWSNASVNTLLVTASAEGQLQLPAALAAAESYIGPLTVTPSAAPAANQLVQPALQVNWYVNDQEVLDPDHMLRVWQRSQAAASFPITTWEFVGSQTVMRLSGYLPVRAAGQYKLYISSGDSFLLQLEQMWVHMRPGLTNRWTADVVFSTPGNYSIELMVFKPATPLAIGWQPPGSRTLVPIPAFYSWGQSFDSAERLMDSQVLAQSTRRSNSSSVSRSSSIAAFVRSSQPAVGLDGFSAADLPATCNISAVLSRRRLLQSPQEATTVTNGLRQAPSGIRVNSEHLLSQPHKPQQQRSSPFSQDGLQGAAARKLTATAAVPWGSPGWTLSYSVQQPGQFRTLLASVHSTSFDYSTALPPSMQYDGQGQDLQGWVLDWLSVGLDQQSMGGIIEGWLDWGVLLQGATPPAGTLAGVTFGLLCDSCSLLLDGAVVVGSLGTAADSACLVKPVNRTAAGNQQKLVHASILITTDSVADAQLQLTYRECHLTPATAANPVPRATTPSTLQQSIVPAVSAGWMLTDADATAQGYVPGMFCDITPAAGAGTWTPVRVSLQFECYQGLCSGENTGSASSSSSSWSPWSGWGQRRLLHQVQLDDQPAEGSNTADGEEAGEGRVTPQRKALQTAIPQSSSSTPGSDTKRLSSSDAQQGQSMTTPSAPAADDSSSNSSSADNSTTAGNSTNVDDDDPGSPAPPVSPAGLKFTVRQLAGERQLPDGAKFDVVCWAQWNGTLPAGYAGVAGDGGVAAISAGGVPLSVQGGGGPYALGPGSGDAGHKGLTPQLLQWGVYAPATRHQVLSKGVLSLMEYTVNGGQWNSGEGGAGLRLLLLEFKGVAADAQLGVLGGGGNAWRVPQGVLWVPGAQAKQADASITLDA